MGKIFATQGVLARTWALMTVLSLILSAFPAAIFIAEAASNGITVNNFNLEVEVGQQVNFVASVITDGSTTTDNTVVVVSDINGGDFFSGTTAGACNSNTPDADYEFAIDQNKGICYSNSVPGEYTFFVQLTDGPGGNPIGDSVTVNVEVKSVVPVTPVVTCELATSFKEFSGTSTNPIFDWNLTASGDIDAITEVQVYRNDSLFSTGGVFAYISAPTAGFIINGGYSHPYNVGVKLLAGTEVIGECDIDLAEVIVPDDGNPIICEDETATNYNEEGDCSYPEQTPIYGCMDSSATNYDVEATEAGEVICEYADEEEEEVLKCDIYEDWASSVHWSNQAKLKNGNAIIDPNRTNSNAVLGAADWVNGSETGFFSLGFGGSIKVGFENYVLDVEGVDISIHEATNGTSYPLEKAEVWVSQNGDDWFMVGHADNTAVDRVTYLDISSSGLAWISYVKVIDVTVPAPHIATADGFDLDAVDATHTTCKKPEPKPVEQCEFEGHKYNQAGTPLAGWMIGLMKVITFNDDSTTKYDVSTSTTDTDGYYCLEWDGYTNTPVHDPETKSFAYRVYEVLQNGWSYLSVEKGPVDTTPEVVDDADVLVEDGRVSVQVGETNGYVYANAAYHVDFYNYQPISDCVGTSESCGNEPSCEDSVKGCEVEDTYRIKGYVWHDDNENQVWDGQNEEQLVETPEVPLAGWTVNITNGTSSFSTTTDENGYYYFDVPAGTWTITETVMDGWGLTTETQHVVTVPEVPVVTLVDKIINYVIPTAYASVLVEYGFYDFGNNEVLVPVVTTGGGSGGGSRSSSGGSSTSTILPTPLVAGVSDSAPEGQVLGEQVSIVPYGAAGAGAGGTANTDKTSALMILSALLTLISLFLVRSVGIQKI